jgi:hypothetical protein
MNAWLRTMNQARIAAVVACGLALGDAPIATAQPFPSRGSPNPAMTGAAASSTAPAPSSPSAQSAAPAPSAAPAQSTPAQTAAPAPPPNVAAPPPPRPATPLPAGSTPRAVTVARATEIPRCSVFVDAAAARGSGTIQSPHKTIAAAIAAAPAGAVICVAEGSYPEQLKPGEKHFTLAGGFQRGANFAVRDSARYISKAQGRGGSFVRIEDPGPKDNQLTAIDGFEITGYAQAIVRDVYYGQRFDVTNNHIHGNKCADNLAGAGVTLNNVSGRVQGNVFRNNACGRGGALFVQDTAQKSTLLVANNLVDNNHGTEAAGSHGGAFYLFGKALTVTGNLFVNNSVTQWGGGLYVGAWAEGGHFTNATMSWNVYRGNRAGNWGGGFFCDDGASCVSEHEIYDRNCGGNVYLDSGTPSGPTKARFSHVTNVRSLDVGCGAPAAGVRIDNAGGAPDAYAFTNTIFWGNAPGKDFAATCDGDCRGLKISVSHSMVQTEYLGAGGAKIAFGAGNIAPADPLLAAPEQGDFHLKSTAGRWTPGGYVQDPVMSPAIAKADPGSPATQNPERAGRRSELGAYGNSSEASYSR